MFSLLGLLPPHLLAYALYDAPEPGFDIWGTNKNTNKRARRTICDNLRRRTPKLAQIAKRVAFST